MNKESIEFMKWYSGMREEKIISAFERFKKENPEHYEIYPEPLDPYKCELIEGDTVEYIGGALLKKPLKISKVVTIYHFESSPMTVNKDNGRDNIKLIHRNGATIKQ